MSIKDILVHVDQSARSQARMELAVQLAQQNNAYLIGLFVESNYNVTAYTPGEFKHGWDEKTRRAGEAMQKEFEALARKGGVSFEWRQIDRQGVRDNDVIEQVILHGRYVDLLVIGQADPEDNGNLPVDLPDEVVVRAGRPVLVVPYSGRYDLSSVRALIAWNGGREAARAVNDAVPLLQYAKSVVVMAVNPEESRGQHGDIPGADICLHLARHGIKAEAQHVTAPDVRVGDILLSRAADEGVNLLICGAFQSSRLKELVLGGVTRHLLGQMTVPVLMSR
ncbi:MAG: universal stress protein [Gammaproteobacteria bacterium]